MRPDGVLALLRVAVGLVAAGVDDLQVVDVAVGLVEVAVTDAGRTIEIGGTAVTVIEGSVAV